MEEERIMKKLFTLAMLFAAAATAFVSCSKDDTTDLLPGIELSGRTKSVTISSSINSTRTELDGHNLKWVEGDTYGIFYIGEDGSSILGYIQSPKYEEGTESYTINNVPEETAYFYCIYPYVDYKKSSIEPTTLDIKAIEVHIPSYDNMSAYEFNSAQHLMAAKTEITDDTVTVKFSPLVSIVEFNIYDTKGVAAGYYFNNVRIDTDVPCSDDCTIDFTAETPTLDMNEGRTYTYAGCGGYSAQISFPSSKEDGFKAYTMIAPGKYGKFDVTVNAVADMYLNDTANYTYEFGDVEFSAFGHTINIDLSNQPLQLIDYAKLTQRGPWTVFLDVTPTSDCEKYVVAAFPTTSSTTSEGDQMNDGWDVNEANFAEIAEGCFETYNSKFGLLQYMVYTGTQKIYQDYFVYDGYSNNDEWNEPKGLRINDEVEEYTVAIYAVNADGESQIVTCTFKPNACTQSSDAGPKIESISNTFNGGSATITANAAMATYLFYGTSTTGVPTFDEIKTLFKDGEGTFVANPKSAITVDFERYNGETVYVWALETAYLGGISKISSMEFAPEEMSYDGSAKVLTFDGTAFTKGMEDQENGDGGSVPCLWGYMDATITLSSDVAKFAIFDLDDATWNLDSGNGRDTYGSSFTIASIKEELAGRILAGKGEGDNVFTATGTEMTIKMFYNNYLVKHHMYALAYGTDGKFGSLINLSAPEMSESAGDEAFLSSDSAYEFKGTVNDYGKGGGSEEPGDDTDLWTSWVVPFFNYSKFDSSIIAYDDNGATNMWIIELAQNIPAEDHTYPFPADAKEKYRTKLGQLFKDYATTKQLSSDAKILASFQGNVPKNATTGEFVIADTPWAQNWSTDSVYALVAEYEDNVLGAVMYAFDDYGDWESMGSVNANNKPKL